MPPSCAPSSTWARASISRSSPRASRASEQLEFLRKHGCYYAQGRLFGDAMEAGKLLAILAGQVRRRAPPRGAVRPGAAAAPRLLRSRRLERLMLSARDLTLRRGPEPLFEQVNFTSFRGDKVGITGANGSGKSSLFAAIRGELAPDRGDIELPGGSEDRPRRAGESPRAIARDRIRAGRRHRAARVRPRSKTPSARDAAAWSSRNCTRRCRPSTAIAPGARGRHHARAGLQGRGSRTPVAEFSGGWRVRLAWRARCARAPICLLLDEPTNHLDLDAIVWLEEWLTTFPARC
jgi:energy-coupling factor transporter ATP-binding protein EcfA2